MVEDKAYTFEGGAYRTSARFGDRVILTLERQIITVSGPRVGRWPYLLWIATLALLIAAIPALVIAAIVLRDWMYAIIAAGVLVGHYLVAAGGAGTFWSLASFAGAVSGHYPSVSFSLDSVKRVSIGRAWSRKGLGWVIPQFLPMIHKASAGHCVSFEAPDGETGRDVVYALYLPKEGNAKALQRLLEGKQP